MIPCCNAPPFLRQTINSVLNQSRVPCEVLVIDDGSTDESATIARSYGPPLLNTERVDRLRKEMLAHLVHHAYRVFYRHEIDEYQLLRRYLAGYSHHSAVQPLLSQAIPPRWLYVARRRWYKLWTTEDRCA